MRIGIDCDGVLTDTYLGKVSSGRVKLPWLILLPLIFVPARRTMVEIVRKWAERKDEIIVISARSRKLRCLTKLWLRLHKIPFHQVFCVGLGKGVESRKLEIAKQQRVEIFFDDDECIVKSLRENGIRAILFK